MSRAQRVAGVLLAGLALAGCATSKAAQQERIQWQAQVGGLQAQVAALTSQVEEMHARQQMLEGRAWDQGTRLGAIPEPRPATRRAHAVLTAKEIQLALQRAGYYHGSVDGKLGPKTRSAIKSFQAANSLVADGVAGMKTMMALQAYLTPSEDAP